MTSQPGDSVELQVLPEKQDSDSDCEKGAAGGAAVGAGGAGTTAEGEQALQ